MLCFAGEEGNYAFKKPLSKDFFDVGIFHDNQTLVAAIYDKA